MQQFMVKLVAGIVNIDLPGPKSDTGLLDSILGAVYFWAGIIAVGMVIFGGFMYVVSNGDAGRVKKAKDTMLYAVIGIVVVLIAFAITKFVIGGVNGS